MKDIEQILENVSIIDKKVPPKVEEKIQYALNDIKNRRNLKKNNKVCDIIYLKKIMTVAALVCIAFIGGITVYGALGGTIKGMPVHEWLGAIFSSEYEEYKEEVKNQVLYHKESSITLTSTVCDDGFTVLEFTVKLGQEDKDRLGLGKTIITDDNNEVEIKDLQLSFNNKPITDEVGTYLIDLNNYKVIIDGEIFGIRPRWIQTMEKISDNEYKIYEMYFLTDKELKDKTEFNLTLADVILKTDYSGVGGEELLLPIEGEFNVKVSKEKAINNTTMIVPICEEIKYKNMTINVDNLMNTPLQTVVKITREYENVSLSKLTYENNPEFIDDIIYNVYNENDKKLSAITYETTRKVTYEDGKTEEWAPGDIGTSDNFERARMEIVEYVIVRKDDDKSKLNIKLSEKLNRKEFGNFEIDLEGEIK